MSELDETEEKSEAEFSQLAEEVDLALVARVTWEAKDGRVAVGAAGVSELTQGIIESESEEEAVRARSDSLTARKEGQAEL